jgi:hypothetical protein
LILILKNRLAVFPFPQNATNHPVFYLTLDTRIFSIRDDSLVRLMGCLTGDLLRDFREYSGI